MTLTAYLAGERGIQLLIVQTRIQPLYLQAMVGQATTLRVVRREAVGAKQVVAQVRQAQQEV